MQYMKKIYPVLFMSLLLISFSAQASVFFDVEKPVLIANKREVVIPAKAKVKLCASVEKEVVKQRKGLITRLKLDKQKKFNAENDHQLQLKKISDEAQLAKAKADKQMKLYKPDETRPIQDNYNANVKAALEVDEKAFFTAIKNYGAKVDGESVKIGSLLKNHIKYLRKIVCDKFGNPTETLNPEGIFATLNASTQAFNNALITLRAARNTANGVFKTALRNADKTKDDALKPLKKIK